MRQKNIETMYLFTKRLEVNGEGETIASRFLVSFTFGKVKAESQQRNGHEWRKLPQLG